MAGVQARITFSVDNGEVPVNETLEVGRPIARRTGTTAPHVVEITDARPLDPPPTLDAWGFELAFHGTEVRDFYDPDELRRVYYPEVEALIAQVSGARRVQVFDHTLRNGNPEEQAARAVREPVLWAHNDYTDWSGPQRLSEILPDEADALLTGRFAIIQVWRAINGPILRNPLALVDARTVGPRDLIRAERRYPHRVGETYQLAHSPAQRWYYYPRMRRDEALVFKVYDSCRDGVARFTPHCSFEDPATPPGAPPRESIEVRTLAFFGTQ